MVGDVSDFPGILETVLQDILKLIFRVFSKPFYKILWNWLSRYSRNHFTRYSGTDFPGILETVLQETLKLGLMVN
jgi:hypothetical protein